MHNVDAKDFIYLNFDKSIVKISKIRQFKSL